MSKYTETPMKFDAGTSGIILSHHREDEQHRQERLSQLLNVLMVGGDSELVLDCVERLHDHKGELFVVFRDGVPVDTRIAVLDLIEIIWETVFYESTVHSVVME